MGKAGHTFRFEVEQLDRDALGVARGDGVELKIPGAAPGDRGVAREVHRSRHRPVAWCRVVEIISRGEAFRTPPCPHAHPVNGRCGGCPAMHLTLSAQAEMKRRWATDALSGLLAARPGLEPDITWTASPEERGYRCRGQFVASRRGRDILLGSYAPRSHDVVSMAGCPVLRAGVDEAAAATAREFQRSGVLVHPSPGGLRYVTVRADNNGWCLVDLVFFGDPSSEALGAAATLVGKAGIVGVSWSRNDRAGNAIRVDSSRLLAGQGTVIESVGGLELELEAGTFSQLNSKTAALMYERAAGAIASADGPLWDLYCGVGGLGLTAAGSCDCSLFGAESVADAVRLAALNGARAGLDATFEEVDLSRRVPAGWPAPGRVAVNPPRRGLDEPVLDYLKTSPATTLVYMSCNPVSFAGDAIVLTDAGWVPEEIHLHDMLPNTTHVELIAVLHR